jgi:hypothetical protein
MIGLEKLPDDANCMIEPKIAFQLSGSLLYWMGVLWHFNSDAVQGPMKTAELAVNCSRVAASKIPVMRHTSQKQMHLDHVCNDEYIVYN